jgi:hypothetical protein
MYTVRELQPNEHEKWNNTLSKSPQGTLFHRLDWNQMLAETDPLLKGTLPLICVDKKDEILAGLILPYRFASDGLRVASPPIGYSTPLLADSLRYAERHHTYSAYSAFADLTQALTERIPSVRMNNSPDIWDIRAYMFHGWDIETSHTHELFRSQDQWETISPDLKTVIEQGRGKFSLQIDAGGNFDDVFASKQNDMETDVLKKRLAWMRANGTGRLFVLTDANGLPAAFTLALLSQPDGRAYLWETNCMEERGASDILPILLWETCSALLPDYPRIDLGYSQNIGISQIKDKLGAQFLPVFNTTFNKGAGKTQSDEDPSE